MDGETGSCAPATQETSMKILCDDLRSTLKFTAERVMALKSHSDIRAENEYPGQRGEMKANIMLTYRHLEDARMRVGKILQAAGDGISILDPEHDKSTD